MLFNLDRFRVLRNEDDDDGGDGGGDGGDAPKSLLPTGGDPNGSGGTPPVAPAPGTPPDGGKFDFRTLIGDDGKFVADYYKRLPENLREHADHFKKYGDPIHALQHTLNLQQLLGKKSEAVTIPAADAPKEEWAPLLKKLGVPDSPEGYNLKVPDDLPHGIKVDEAEIKQFAGFAHEIGLTPQQVAKLQEYDLTRTTKQLEGNVDLARTEEVRILAEQQEILTKEWGNGPDADQKKQVAIRAALTLGFNSDDIGDHPLFRNAEFVKAMYRAGALMSEDKLVGADATSGPVSNRAKANDIITNSSNPLYKRYWDGDESVVASVRSMMK